jgi:hypothetical protein
MAMNSAFRKTVLNVECPRCHRRNGRWCRDEKGKCIPPHRERSRAALELLIAPFSTAQQKPNWRTA